MRWFTFLVSDVSISWVYLLSQMLFNLPAMYKLHLHLSFSRLWGYFLLKFYICIPRFLWPEDASHWNHASATCFFYNLQILLIKIFHLQSPKIRHRRYFHSISFKFYLVHDDLQARKDYALLLSFVGQARLQFAGLHSLFLAFWRIVVERCRTMRRFTFLVSDVSTHLAYSVL